MMDLAAHRPQLLRHCYRMLGSFADAEDVVQDVLVSAWKARASFSGDVPVVHWLMRIATNTCLNELAKRKRRSLPALEREPGTTIDEIEQVEAATWITPAPERVLETRESVALAFIALLQRLPPRQRATLLLKDVVGWSAEEIAATLDLSVSATNSALHRAREAIGTPRNASADPPAALLREFIRSWEEHDVEGLVALLRDDVALAMPPHATWFRGPQVVEFLRSARFARFWMQGVKVSVTRANGQLALMFFVRAPEGLRRHSLQLVEFVDGRVAEMLQFIGDFYLHGFEQFPAGDLSIET